MISRERLPISLSRRYCCGGLSSARCLSGGLSGVIGSNLGWNVVDNSTLNSLSCDEKQGFTPDAVMGGAAHDGSACCGVLPFLIRRDGTWLYRGSPIARKELVCLFASVLRRDRDGYKLRTPVEEGRIEVEDAPFVAVELDWTGCGRHQTLTFRTNVDQLITAGKDHPIRVAHDILTCEPTPYLHVRDGEDGAPPVEARISRAVYYELVALAEPHDVCCRRMLGVWSCGTFFALGEMPPHAEQG
ncbi:Hypothetical protein GbCGDNIH1_1635 [Granulibacter bethesdensis CGDNIH1]|uniref:DUF1285 domain-containing protein n=2 Tax=Granulibacter bethesdensis TaxID=364410 RepID=Q0BRL9_GRABC|nr:Hypothetical protein GbCGDNIH1_1635 [Granulibacter bethesdensis CGDNIH1]APH52379.1 Hypothetical protein GbCGDNIH5_1635 [Granulibacter bethesdensis]APH65069.1 Hypothetical protein GbCGDNIH1I4_1635 [Granulibacter bethesdensis]